MRLIVRQASRDEFKVAIDWARDEGWNPGLDDLDAFFAADPNGFFMGLQGGKPVSAISTVRYGSDFGFLGFYLVHPDHRGMGVGLATWKVGMAYLAGRTVGLDGVVDQQDNYRSSGFCYAGRNVRYQGTATTVLGLPTDSASALITELSEEKLPALFDYARAFFPAERNQFFRAWTLPPAAVRRRSYIAQHAGNTVGIITIRQCVNGHKIGPLFADTSSIAAALLHTAISSVPLPATIVLDVPEDNAEAVVLSKRFGLSPVFETARMYRLGPYKLMPYLALERTFAITSFELG